MSRALTTIETLPAPEIFGGAWSGRVLTPAEVVEQLDHHGYEGIAGSDPHICPADAETVAFADKLIRDWPEVLDPEQRKPELYRFIRALLERDMLLEEIVSAADYQSFVNFRPGLTRDEVREVLQMALEDHQMPEAPPRDFAAKPDAAAPERIVLRHEPKNLVADVDTTLRAMVSDTASGELLNHGGHLAEVRDGRVYHFDDLAAMRLRAMRSVRFFVWKGVGKGANWEETATPDNITYSLLSSPLPGVPELRGMICAPTICPNGRVVDRPGFDPSTRLHCAFGSGEFWVLPSAPTHERARQAYRWLVDTFFAQFPFASPLDEAAAVAALLTGLVRRTCGIAPAFMTEAPTQSSGKSALLEIIAHVVSGRKPDPLTWREEDGEITNTVLGMLRQSAPVIFWDNVPAGTRISSGVLARLLTQSSFGGRVLHTHRVDAFPTDVLVLLSGNNLMLEGDIPSRVVSCRDGAHREAPEKRTFGRQLGAWVERPRGEVVNEALIIIKAYIAAGSPATSASPTRFPTWGRMVAAPIAWVSGEDVAAKFSTARENDPKRDLLRDVMQAWLPALGAEPVSASAILRQVEAPGMDLAAAAPVEAFSDREEFARAVKAAYGDARTGRMNVQWIGTWLLENKGRVIDGYVLENSRDSHTKRNNWLIRSISAASAASAAAISND